MAEVYAVSQGPVSISDFGEARPTCYQKHSHTRTHCGRWPAEREIKFALNDLPEICLALKNPDFTRRAALPVRLTAIHLRPCIPAMTPQSLKPFSYPGTLTDLITDVEQLPVEPDQVARVVIDENSGTIVMGADVRVSTVAIAQGNLTIKVNETPQVSQPNPFAEQGETTVVDRTDIDVNQGEDTRLAVLESGVTLQDLVTGLNKLGVGPRDIITILQAIKAAGALQAEIETM